MRLNATGRKQIMGASQQLNCVIAALLLHFIFCTPAAHAATNKQETATEVKQVHYFLGGHVVTATKDAVRIENVGGFKYILVSKAPEWRINIFRNDDKTYFSESLQEFAETGLISDFLVSRRKHFVDKRKFLISPMKFLGRDAIRASGGESNFKYLPAEPGTDPQIDLIVHSTYKLSTWGGLPLEETGITDKVDYLSGQKKNKHQNYLVSSSIKTINVSPEIFELPKNYAKATSLREVVSGNGSRQESEDAQQLFDIGKKKPN